MRWEWWLSSAGEGTEQLALTGTGLISSKIVSGLLNRDPFPESKKILAPSDLHKAHRSMLDFQ